MNLTAQLLASLLRQTRDAKRKRELWQQAGSLGVASAVLRLVTR